MKQRIILALLALAAAAPAAGQEWLVNRDRFRYVGTRLTIDVVTEAPGRVQIIRGQDGWVGVAGRAPQGFAAAGLTDDDHLTLSAAGGGPIDYMVTVPEGVWIVVRLPDRTRTESVGGHTRVSTFEWMEAVGRRDYAAAWDAYVPLPDEAVAPGLFTTYTASLAPATLALPELRAVRSVTIRTGGGSFRIATSRPLSLEPGSHASFEIRPAGDPMDIVIDIPEGTAGFALDAAGVRALTIDAGELVLRCGPATRQWLSGGRQWVTFTPVHGRLDCAPPPAPSRHKG